MLGQYRGWHSARLGQCQSTLGHYRTSRSSSVGPYPRHPDEVLGAFVQGYAVPLSWNTACQYRTARSRRVGWYEYR
eukprot:588896-Rhodomonas_salina.3